MSNQLDWFCILFFSYVFSSPILFFSYSYVFPIRFPPAPKKTDIFLSQKSNRQICRRLETLAGSGYHVGEPKTGILFAWNPSKGTPTQRLFINHDDLLIPQSGLISGGGVVLWGYPGIPMI